MRRVEITEEVLKDGVTTYHQNDVVTVDDDKAAQWISLGWARDPETGEQGDRKPGVHKVEIQPIQQSSE